MSEEEPPKGGAPSSLPPAVLHMLLPYRVPPDPNAGEQEVDGPRRADAERSIEVAREEFERTRNPLYAWHAYLECRGHALLIPEWVLAYLDQAARNLWSFVERSPSDANSAVPSDANSAVAEALLLKPPGKTGRGTAFSQVLELRWICLGGMVALYIRHGDKESIAVEEVASRNNTSASTVWRAWRRYKAAFIK